MLYLKGDEVLMMALMRKEPDTAPLLRTARSRESCGFGPVQYQLHIPAKWYSNGADTIHQWHKKETDTIHHTIS